MRSLSLAFLYVSLFFSAAFAVAAITRAPHAWLLFTGIAYVIASMGQTLFRGLATRKELRFYRQTRRVAVDCGGGWTQIHTIRADAHRVPVADAPQALSADSASTSGIVWFTPSPPAASAASTDALKYTLRRRQYEELLTFMRRLGVNPRSFFCGEAQWEHLFGAYDNHAEHIGGPRGVVAFRVLSMAPWETKWDLPGDSGAGQPLAPRGERISRIQYGVVLSGVLQPDGSVKAVPHLYERWTTTQ